MNTKSWVFFAYSALFAVKKENHEPGIPIHGLYRPPGTIISTFLTSTKHPGTKTANFAVGSVRSRILKVSQ